MKEGTSKHLALLAVELYEVSENFIYELREKQHVRQDVFEYLPEFTINKNETANNQPITAKYYHQFMGQLKPDDDNQKYLYFNLATQDSLLHHEMSESGLEDFFQGMDFEKFLLKFTPQNEENIRNFVFPTTNYLVVELTYITTYDHYSGAYEGDLEVEVIGYLDHALQRQPFEIPTRSTNTFQSGDIVLLPFKEEGEIIEYVDLPWGSRYNVKITKSNGFNEVGEICDFFEKDLELKIK